MIKQSLKKEIEKRKEKVISIMEKNNIDLLYLTSPANIMYLSGFSFISTERPIAFMLKRDGESVIFVPRLEVEHIQQCAMVDNIIWYSDYPDEKHPIEILAEYLTKMGMDGKTIGYDVDGYGEIYGYRGPRLSSKLKTAKYVPARDYIEDLRKVKSEYEINLLKESGMWAGVAHKFLQEYIRPDAYEDEISMKASMDTTSLMIKVIKGYYSFEEAFVGFRGQVGVHSYFPHSLNIHAKIKKGDILVTGAGPKIDGYSAELERTLIVGEPTEKQEKFFNLMVKARNIAFEKLKPNVSCSEIDKTVRKFYKDEGIYDYWRHHTGHSIGLEMHEAPFLDIGYNYILKPGNVFTIEPGIYIEGLGGFRHSDTVVITEDGYELITKYPQELEDLIILP